METLMTDENDWYSPEAATFGDRLAGAREAAGMTQAELARRLGVKKSTIGDWENDLSEPRANRLQMLAGILNVSISWLLTGEGEGIETPDQPAEPVEMRELMSEMRVLRSQMTQAADRIGVLEKRLKSAITDSAA